METVVRGQVHLISWQIFLIFVALFTAIPFHYLSYCEAFLFLSPTRKSLGQRTETVQRPSFPVLSPSSSLNTANFDGTTLYNNSHYDNVDDVDDSLLQKWRSEDTTGVYDALDELELEIRLENADQKLQFAQHLDSIEYLERGKHLLFPNIIKHIVVPMAYALLLYRFSSTKIVKAFRIVMDLHFWVFVVGAPMILLPLYRWTKRNKEIPDPIQHLPPDFRMALYKDLERRNVEDPDYSCNDHVLFLLEYWVSAVKAMIVVPFLQIFLCRYCGRELAISSSAACLWCAVVQLVTRIAGMASLYQYPEMLYRLQRSFQPRPIGFFPTITRNLVHWMLQLAPLGFISDFSKVTIALPKRLIYPLYASIFLLLYGLWIRIQDAEQQMEDQDTKEPSQQFTPRLRPMENSKKIFYGICIGVLWLRALWPYGPLIRDWVLWFLTQTFLFTTPFFLVRFFGNLFLLCYPLIGPIVHIAAILKAISVLFCGDEPILTVISNSKDPQVLSSSEKQWKYRVKWREPERFWLMRHKLSIRLQRRLFSKGPIQEQLEMLEIENLKLSISEGKHIWERAAQDLENDAGTFSRNLPSTLKAKAMKSIAKRHEENYNAGKSSEDPLGIALYRGFGVGLNLDDYTKIKSMKNGEGGNRRLQILAIEKAIQRYKDLWDRSKRLEKQEENFDKDLKQQLKAQREAEETKEIEYLAKRITNLVPSTSDGSLDDSESLSRFRGEPPPQRSFRRVSSHEAILLEDSVDSMRMSGRLNQDVEDELEDPFRDDRKRRDEDVTQSSNEPLVKFSPSVTAMFNATDEEDETGNENPNDDDDNYGDGDDSNDDDSDEWEPTVYHA